MSTTTQRTAKVRAQSEHLLDLFIGLKEKYTILHPMVFNLDLGWRIGTNKAAWGFAIVRNSLLLGCLQDVAKITLDGDDRTPSIGNIMKALSDDAVRRECRETFSAGVVEVLPDDESYKEEDGGVAASQAVIEFGRKREAERQAAFDVHYLEMVRLWDALKDSPELLQCRTIRDKVIAHTELHHHPDGSYKLLDMSAVGLKWVDIEPLIAKIQVVVAKVNLVARSSSFAFDGLSAQFADAAAAFWPLQSTGR